MLNSLARKLTCFVQRLHLGRLCIRLCAASDLQLDRLRKLVSYFCDPEQGGADAKAFVAILRWVHLRLSWMESFRAWSPGARLRADWTHAAQLQVIFNGAGPPNELAMWFLGHCREIDANFTGATTPFEHDVCHPRNVDHGGVVVRGLIFLFEDAPESTLITSGVREALSQALEQQGKNLTGSPSLWQPVTRQPNQLESFLGTRLELCLPRMIGADLLKKHFDFDTGSNMQSALEQLQLRPADANLWILLEFLGGSGGLNDAEKGYVARALSKVEFLREFKTNANLPELIMGTCQHAATLGDTTIKSKLRAQLLNLACAAASMPSSGRAEPEKGPDWRRLGGALLDAACRLNIVPDNPSATASAFLTDAAAILRAWPALAAQCRPSLTALITKLPVECQTAWLPLQLELRALG